MALGCPEFGGGKAECGKLKIEIGILESAVSGLPDGMGILKSWGDALTGLRNVWGGLPRASLADSLCPGLTSGCAFGAKKGLVPTRCGRGLRSEVKGQKKGRDHGVISFWKILEVKC